ncbi:MAG: hypothetical protein R3B45_12405 [Bdellovibrionota bacterium]
MNYPLRTNLKEHIHKFCSLYIISLSILSLSSSIGFADDFDFGEESKSEHTPKQFEETKPPIQKNSKDLYPRRKNTRSKKKSQLLLPIKGDISLNLARQFEDKETRWMELGPAINSQLNWSGFLGSLNIEGSYFYNYAYEQEKDIEELQKESAEESILREAYYKKALGPISFTIGRTIIVWGKQDLLSVVDVVTPSNQAELFFSKPADARLGQDLAAIDIWAGTNNQLSLIYIPFPQLDRRPSLNHPYRLTPEAIEIKPENEEGAARWNYEGSSLSIALLTGKFHLRSPLFSTDNLGQLQAEYPNYEIIGLTGQLNFQHLLVKGEFAYLPQFPQQSYILVNDTKKSPRITNLDSTASSLGFDFSHHTLGNFTLEVSYRQIIENFVEDENINTTFGALTWNKSFFRDTLMISHTHMNLDSMQNLIERFAIKYKITDTIDIDTQYTWINTDKEDPNFAAINDFDRADIILSFHFSGA